MTHGTEPNLVGRTVVDYHGDKIGTITQLLTSGDDTQPGWAVVKTDLLGIGSSVIPLDHSVDDDGDIGLVYEKDHVKRMPDVEFEGDHLDDHAANRLALHYGLERVTGLTAPGNDDDIELARETRHATLPDSAEDGALAERRRERARELGVPSAQPQDGA